MAAGIRKPLAGRMEIAYRLYPGRPLDWRARMRKDPLWADGVRCIDLGNANKVLEDALNGTVIEDDRWTWRLTGEKMEPDADGARLVVWVRPIVAKQPEQLAIDGA
jgi:crossover junction endodeoxyribonuclease RusA